MSIQNAFRFGGVVDPSTLGAKAWFDGSDVSKFVFTGSDVDTFISSIDSGDTIDFQSRTIGIRADDALASKVGLSSRYDYTGTSHSLSGNFTLLWKAKTNIDGLANCFVINDSPVFVYIVQSSTEFNKYRDSTGSGGLNSGVISSLGYVNIAVVGNSTNRSLYENNSLVDTKTQGTGAIETGGFVLDNNTSLASSQTFIKQLIYFDRVLNATELTQMNDFLDSK
jgi:hypothetical protein